MNFDEMDVMELQKTYNEIDLKIRARQKEAIQQAIEILKKAFPAGIRYSGYYSSWEEIEWGSSTEQDMVLNIE